MAVDLIDAPVQDQGKLGSCFFNGETTQMEYMEIKDKQPKLLMFSRLFAYYIYRTEEGDVPDDTGAYPRVGLSLAKKYGVCLESTWPYDLNNFVVKPPQAAYDEAYDGLFAALDELEERLSRRRYLVDHQQTEADWRLFPTLVRFDVAYFSLFKCNKKRIADYPNLSNYMRELYRVPGVPATVKSRYYVINYYSIAKLNPTGIIPKGTPVDLEQPHDRVRLAA